MGYSWEVALTAVFVEGIIFIILSLTNVREAIFNAIPMNLKYAVSGGIDVYKRQDMGRLRHTKNEMCRCLYTYKQDFYKASLVFQNLLHDIGQARQKDNVVDIKLWEVDKYIRHHFCENITLEELAKIYGTSQSYFTRAYKAVYHKPPMQMCIRDSAFTGRVFIGKNFPDGCFVPGRHAMTCCADDIQFIGFICKTKHIDKFKNCLLYTSS